MTDILADIDDTLADWHGSNDSRRWRPEPTPEQARQVFVEFTALAAASIRQRQKNWRGRKR